MRGIVDKAVKEMGMEKVLRELDVTWAQMEFEHNAHPRTKITLLGATEELIETLEDNQVQLQNMLTSKYIAFFQEQVSSWQKKLSNADQVSSLCDTQCTSCKLSNMYSVRLRSEKPYQSWIFM